MTSPVLEVHIVGQPSDAVLDELRAELGDVFTTNEPVSTLIHRRGVNDPAPEQQLEGALDHSGIGAFPRTGCGSGNERVCPTLRD